MLASPELEDLLVYQDLLEQMVILEAPENLDRPASREKMANQEVKGTWVHRVLLVHQDSRDHTEPQVCLDRPDRQERKASLELMDSRAHPVTRACAGLQVLQVT